MSYPDAPLMPDPIRVLAAAFADYSIPFVTQVPKPRPDEDGSTPWLRAVISGGSDVSGVLGFPRMTLECWAPTQELALDLAASAWQTLKQMRGTVVNGVPIGRVNCSQPRWVPDSLAPAPRYDLTPEFVVRGST